MDLRIKWRVTAGGTLTAFVLAIIGFVFVLSVMPARGNERDTQVRKGVRIVGEGYGDKNHPEVNQTFTAVWARKDAIKFGLEQTAWMIRYMFAGSSVVLIMLAKNIIDSQWSEKQDLLGPVRLADALLQLYCGLFCLTSSVAGLFAFSYFSFLATDPVFRFTAISSFQISVKLQFVSLTAGFMCLGLVLVRGLGFRVHQLEDHKRGKPK